MSKFPIVLDLETKHSLREYSEPEQLGVSVVGLFNYENNQTQVLTEKELNKLFSLLEQASYIIGFNINHFDLPVLQKYYPGSLSQFPTLDILKEIKEKIGRRLSLNDIVGATLGKKKTGHGLKAIDYYKEGNWKALKKYCLDDVMLTKELFEFGFKQGEIYYLDEMGKVSIKVDWKQYLEDSGKTDIPLTLPF